MAERAAGPSRVAVGLAIALPFLVAAGLLLFDELSSASCSRLEDVEPDQGAFDEPPCTMTSDEYLYFAEIHTTAGPIRIALDPILSPDGVNNFVFLAEAGFYDDTPIHKVEVTDDHSFIQMGDPTGTGRGNAGYTFEPEPPSPIAKYTRGAVALVFPLTDAPAASSQFIIFGTEYEALALPTRTPNLPIIGYVIDEESMLTVDTMLALGTEDGRPLEELRIHRVGILQKDRFTAGEPDAPTEPSPFAPVTPTATSS